MVGRENDELGLWVGEVRILNVGGGVVGRGNEELSGWG